MNPVNRVALSSLAIALVIFGFWLFLVWVT
jgi:hypothetical protein